MECFWRDSRSWSQWLPVKDGGQDLRETNFSFYIHIFKLFFAPLAMCLYIHVVLNHLSAFLTLFPLQFFPPAMC